MLFTKNLVLIFIITILLLAGDFYYLKNIAGRRLVGLRWWNEVDLTTGDSQWVFESSEPGTKIINPTDSRFFWLALYSQPALWFALALVAIINIGFKWLPLVGELLSISALGPVCRLAAGGGVVLGLFVARWLALANVSSLNYSHRPCPHRHEYPRLLTLRQVQPGVEYRRKCPILG